MKRTEKGKAVRNDRIAFELKEAWEISGFDKITEIADHVYDFEDVP